MIRRQGFHSQGSAGRRAGEVDVHVHNLLTTSIDVLNGVPQVWGAVQRVPGRRITGFLKTVWGDGTTSALEDFSTFKICRALESLEPVCPACLLNPWASLPVLDAPTGRKHASGRDSNKFT